tara:strand:+ start:1549 stop:1707 length:159 start_codon:yes stop_codon:yes gene_type:complete
MIHRAPMTEEDMKYRQGRSKQQYNNSYFGIKASVVLLGITLLGYLIFKYFEV